MTPTPIILDCDPGHDDAIALLLALASPELELVGVTTVCRQPDDREDDGERAARARVRRPRRRAGAPRRRPRRSCASASVAAHVHGESGLDGPDLPAADRPPSGPSTPSTSWPSEIRARDGRLTLVPTGPLTNIALLLALHPDARPERIVLMGGSIGEGNRTPAAEFNIWADPEAAQRVFASGIDMTMIGLDVTHQALITDEHTERAARRRAGRGGWSPS